MMKGIWFDNIHSHTDLNLVLSKVDIPPATAKTTFVDIPGGDGSADLTEALGEVRFKDRECEFAFTVFPSDDFEQKKRQVSNLLNGKRCKIKVDKDPGYYLDGRCTVNEYASDKNIHKIVVGANVAPYKLKNSKTSVFVPFCGKNLFDNSSLEPVGGSGCDISTIATGVRLSWRSQEWSYLVVRFLPLKMLLGKTITLSATTASSGQNRPMFRIGYTSADGSNRVAKTGLYGTGKVSLTVTEEAGFEYLAVWFYANAGTATSLVSEGDYVDYTNIQIEIGGTSTGYEAYTPTASVQEVTLTNSRKTVVPTIICTDSASVTVGGSTFNFSEGSFKNLNIQLREGGTPVSCSGTGAVAFVYQEGDL